MSQMLQIEAYTPTDSEAYDAFLLGDPSTLVYQTSSYMGLLENLLGATNATLLARDDEGQLKGALPLMRKEGPFGAVLNSLPFYGSNGALIARNTFAADALRAQFMRVAQQEDVAAWTVVENPLDPSGFVPFEAAMEEARIGQFTPLPQEGNIPDALMTAFHGKTRNMVRKTEKLGIEVRTDPTAFDFLARTHTDNMAEIGGQAKSHRFFDLVPSYFNAGRDYQIYVASLDGVDIAALLVLFWNKTVEYYTPVVVKAHRSSQPLSALIFQAMCDAAERGYVWWNWGGTWHSQAGVYQFKSRWGTRDIDYRYKIQVNNTRLLDATPHQLLEGYPGFYTAPFSKLRPASNP